MLLLFTLILRCRKITKRKNIKKLILVWQKFCWDQFCVDVFSTICDRFLHKETLHWYPPRDFFLLCIFLVTCCFQFFIQKNPLQNIKHFPKLSYGCITQKKTLFSPGLPLKMWYSSICVVILDDALTFYFIWRYMKNCITLVQKKIFS